MGQVEIPHGWLRYTVLRQPGCQGYQITIQNTKESGSLSITHVLAVSYHSMSRHTPSAESHSGGFSCTQLLPADD